jgi:hypothetical protein
VTNAEPRTTRGGATRAGTSAPVETPVRGAAPRPSAAAAGPPARRCLAAGGRGRRCAARRPRRRSAPGSVALGPFCAPPMSSGLSPPSRRPRPVWAAADLGAVDVEDGGAVVAAGDGDVEPLAQPSGSGRDSLRTPDVAGEHQLAVGEAEHELVLAAGAALARPPARGSRAAPGRGSPRRRWSARWSAVRARRRADTRASRRRRRPGRRPTAPGARPAAGRGCCRSSRCLARTNRGPARCRGRRRRSSGRPARRRRSAGGPPPTARPPSARRAATARGCGAGRRGGSGAGASARAGGPAGAAHRRGAGASERSSPARLRDRRAARRAGGGAPPWRR